MFPCIFAVKSSIPAWHKNQAGSSAMMIKSTSIVPPFLKLTLIVLHFLPSRQKVRPNPFWNKFYPAIHSYGRIPHGDDKMEFHNTPFPSQTAKIRSNPSSGYRFYPRSRRPLPLYDRPTALGIQIPYPTHASNDPFITIPRPLPHTTVAIIYRHTPDAFLQGHL